MDATSPSACPQRANDGGAGHARTCGSAPRPRPRPGGQGRGGAPRAARRTIACDSTDRMTRVRSPPSSSITGGAGSSATVHPRRCLPRHRQCRRLARWRASTYRLAPERKYPARSRIPTRPLTWLAGQASALGIDVGRLAVGWGQRGGNLGRGGGPRRRDRRGGWPSSSSSIRTAHGFDTVYRENGRATCSLARA